MNNFPTPVALFIGLALGVGALIQLWYGFKKESLYFGKGQQGAIPSVFRSTNPIQFWLLFTIQLGLGLVLVVSSLAIFYFNYS